MLAVAKVNESFQLYPFFLQLSPSIPSLVALPSPFFTYVKKTNANSVQSLALISRLGGIVILATDCRSSHAAKNGNILSQLSRSRGLRLRNKSE